MPTSPAAGMAPKWPPCGSTVSICRTAWATRPAENATSARSTAGISSSMRSTARTRASSRNGSIAHLPGRPDQFPSLGASYHRRLREGAMQRHALTDDEWARIEPLLPKPPRTGRPPKDHRLILDALLWLGKTGAPWRDLPERFGPWRSIATRFYRWTRAGLWERILAELRRIADARGPIDWEVHMVDGTSVRAHRHAGGARGATRTGAGVLARRVRQQTTSALRPARPAHGLRADAGRAE